MNDEVGHSDYSYDQLSRLTSESRTFDTVGPLIIGYEYNLSGQLKKITDPTNMAIAYTYDKVGHNTAISGENSLYAGVTQYASNLSYRAWGALKEMTYGNNYKLTVSFNGRLLPTQFQVTKPPALGSTPMMNTQYYYYPDASLKFADRITTIGQQFDRAFSYDQVSMLKEAYSGGEARDFVNGTSGSGAGPYRQTYQHDVFGSLTSRTGNYWGVADAYTATYLNNRRQDPSWQFDADGRLKQDGTVQYSYDASGENRSLYEPEINKTTTLLRDGDGREIKRVDAPSGSSITTYYLRSSVLDGRVIGEYSQTGQKNIGYVFAGSEVLAWQQFGSVTWKHVDPLTGSAGQSIQNGTFTSTAELDPAGANIGTTNPFVDPPQFSPEPFLPMLTGDEGSCGSNPNCVRCTLHGFEIGCGFIGHMMSGGLVALDPDHPSDSALEKLGAQPIFSTFCIEVIATVGATAPSPHVGMAGATPPAPGDPGARECTTELTGYTEGTLSTGMNLHPLQGTTNPQKSGTEDNPNELQSDNNGKDCGVVVTFRPGTSNKSTGLPNGPSTITHNGGPNFGLGFSVSGWVGDGGIGTIGIDATTGKKVTNPANPKGRWSLEQWTHSWIGDNGKTLVSRATFPDLPLNAAGLRADGNTFGYYDHPGGPPPSAGFARYDNYLIKVYAGKTVCEVGFHMIQTGNKIVWGRGLR